MPSGAGKTRWSKPGDRLEGLFASGGPLAASKPGYSRRPQQVEMSHAVGKTLSEKGVLLADAPTGTGKSISYIASALLRAVESDEKVVISTATLSLQSQLLSEDLPPALAAVASLLGYPEDEGPSVAVMKGRSNYLCDLRFRDTLEQPDLLDGELLANLQEWAATTPTGDREELEFPVPTSKWLDVASDGEDCAPTACPFREQCHYYAHRDRAQESEILVVNHALLLANVAAYGNIFDVEGRHLIIDEAHRLEEIMTESFGARVSYPRVRYVMRQAKKKCENVSEEANRAEASAQMFFEELRTNQALGSEENAPRAYRTLVESLQSVRKTLAHDPSEAVNKMQGMVGRLRRDLTSFYAGRDAEEGGSEDDYAYAVVAGRSRDPYKKPDPELRSWLIETAGAFRDDVLPLFEDGGVVLTSATLANGGRERSGSSGSGRNSSFGYTRRRLGLEEGPAKPPRQVDEHAGGEVFDYAERVLIYVEDGLDAPASSGARDYSAACARRVRELLELASGSGADNRAKALVLLSTSRAVSVFREVFEAPAGASGEDTEVRFQGDDSSGRLIRWLRESAGPSVLVGTRGMWEGSDVFGLSLVVIDKVPFAPPNDPVIQKLCERAGAGWFKAVTLPKAQMAMRQGAGRLMRRPSDRGVIALLDPRISKKGWGKSILAALPPAPRTSSLSEVREFFARDGAYPE